jgi:hypothetical protein
VNAAALYVVCMTFRPAKNRVNRPNSPRLTYSHKDHVKIQIKAYHISDTEKKLELLIIESQVIFIERGC